ncbi:dTDP-4-dehydrorhamnose reductase [Gammaproteobacteria bacterium]|nr:dTDP-4-dehydrorhamnose reductase [Gammaproteobacteria bacterium]
MRVLILGSNGQLGQELQYESCQKSDLDCLFLPKYSLDITNKGQIDNFLKNNSFDYIINCAAYTNVNNSESDPDAAFLVNQIAIKYLVNGIMHYCPDTRFIHISTDYVFNAIDEKPMTEYEYTDPINTYGESKLRGEIELQKIPINSLILRTSWLYSSFGSNFVKKIVSASSSGKELYVVNDQIGSPTYAGDLAQGIFKILSMHHEAASLFKSKQIYHFSNHGSCSWFELSEQIIKLLKLNTVIHPVDTVIEEGDCPRPKFSVLCSKKFEADFNYSIPAWRDSLKKCINKITGNDFVYK